MSTFNNSRTPLRVLGNTVRTISTCSISVVLANGRTRVHHYTTRGHLRLQHAHVISTPRIVAVRSSTGDILHDGGSSSLNITFRLLGTKRKSTLIDTNGANTIAMNTALVAKQVGKIGQPTVTSIVPSTDGPFLVVSYNTGTRYGPRFLCRFKLLNSLCVRRILRIGGPQITLTGGKARPAGNAPAIQTTCSLVATTPCGFINGVRNHRVPFKSTSIIITSNFANGLVLGACRNITGILVGRVGNLFGGGTFALLSTLNISNKLGGVGTGFSCGRCNNTMVLKMRGPIIGTRNSTSTHAFGGTVGRTI